MPLLRNGQVYGANVGGAGWYGVITDPSEIQNQIQGPFNRLLIIKRISLGQNK